MPQTIKSRADVTEAAQSLFQNWLTTQNAPFHAHAKLLPYWKAASEFLERPLA
jgi:hypothetical protein